MTGCPSPFCPLARQTLRAVLARYGWSRSTVATGPKSREANRSRRQGPGSAGGGVGGGGDAVGSGRGGRAWRCRAGAWCLLPGPARGGGPTGEGGTSGARVVGEAGRRRQGPARGTAGERGVVGAWASRARRRSFRPAHLTACTDRYPRTAGAPSSRRASCPLRRGGSVAAVPHRGSGERFRCAGAAALRGGPASAGHGPLGDGWEIRTPRLCELLPKVPVSARNCRAGAGAGAGRAAAARGGPRLPHLCDLVVYAAVPTGGQRPPGAGASARG